MSNFIPRDFENLREEGLAQLPIITNGQYTDLNEGDPGIAIAETVYAAIAKLIFQMEKQFGELYLPTASQRLSVLNLLRLIGYEIQGVRASTGTVEISVDLSSGPAPLFPITIKAGTTLGASANNKSINFTTTEEAIITGITDSKIVPVIQGTLQTDSFNSDSSPDQRFQLSANNIDRTTVRVFINDDPTNPQLGTEWTMVSSFYKSTLNDEVFRVESDENNLVYVIFSDGIFGKVPDFKSRIDVSYFVTDGANGIVGRNAINRIDTNKDFVSDRVGNSVQLLVVNASATSGGADVETLEHAEGTAQALLFGLNQAISRQDFAALAKSVPGVDLAVAWGENEESNPDYRLLNTIRISIFSKAFADMYSNPASRDSYRNLRDDKVRKLLIEKALIGTFITFIDPVLVDIFVTINLAIDTAKYDPNTVLDAVRTALNAYYNFDTVVFGQDIRISDILSVISKISGVGWARITRLHTTAPNQTDAQGNPLPDLAPTPPQDIVLEKWKIPTFTDVPLSAIPVTPTSAPIPYLSVITPPTTQTGLVTISVMNPDGQSDVLVNGFSIFTGPNLSHITLTYSQIVDEPGSFGGYYGHPVPENDLTTFSSAD